MQENARQGFWNGARPPLGYRTFAAETRGDKVKKRLEIDPAEAEIVRLIFRLYSQGAGNGPLGIKGCVSYLNHRGIRYRKARFSSQNLHGVLDRKSVV